MIYIHCDNKGCGEHQTPKIDKETNEVICDECGKPISNVTDFFKRQLISFGQIVRNEKTQRAFSVKCTKCNKEDQPILNSDGDIQCAHCKHVFGDELSKPFKNTLKQFLRNALKG